MTLFHKGDNWFVGPSLEKRSCHLRGIGSFFSVTDPVYRGDQNSILATVQEMVIARLALARKSELGNSVFDDRDSYCFHFFTVTVVP